MKLKEFKGILSELRAAAEVADNTANSELIRQHPSGVIRVMEDYFNEMYYSCGVDESGANVILIYDNVRQADYIVRGTRARII